MGWVPASEALKRAPFASGIYKIGIRRRSIQVETIYIGVTATGGSIRETLSKLFCGLEGDPHLMEFVSSAFHKKHVLVDWSVRLFPKDDINDVMREYIKATRRLPIYNRRAEEEKDSKEPYIIKEWNMANPNLFHK
ncbi:uncharacterized protein LOC142344109 [Convolutriloba macropyga]|uniref:uncharacterized protein LOC142344109 n=1 Tax=Convolutriloba macropyga TaxID=536237 RepID=UPI003F527FBB